MYGVKITGTGRYLPEKEVSNFDMEKMVDTTDEWIRSRSGIEKRRFVAEDQATSDMAFIASKKALEKAGVRPEELDMIIVGTYTPDMPFPSVACMIQGRLGAKNAWAYDLQAACSGFVFSLITASQFIKAGSHKKILVVGGDTSSSILDFEDRTSCVLFGDGAGAVVIEPCEEGKGIIDYVAGADGTGAEYIEMPAGGSRNPASHETVEKRMHYFKMNGKEVFKFSTRALPAMIKEILERNSIAADQIKLLIPHQANIRIIQSGAKKAGIPKENIFVNLDKYGNTVAGTIPIALDEALEQGRIKEGDLVLLSGFGGGLTWGTLLIRWQ
ncbi:MAG: 3-oxoacyl-ACP synthase [Candidatus Muiribacterium halophilum]|uniref:Beta-ketoacyl-[acyl-carrier-protein] synthase III n=1 Tax=Muiribacterium halophilum TaxID=2053465 RepID=A0A2N5Z9D3_MUIH1|nr:MAG: 3-oxoacyl-ACP synthase [Candidatus Muirbacterium halophilum]